MIGVVVPVCNRRDNLELLLASLECQTHDDFTVVVADDGSADGTRDYVENTARLPCWSGRLQWIGCGPDFGVRLGRARNIGVANLPEGTQLVVMFDSDLVLQPQAMELFEEAHRVHPAAVLLGAVEWLPPLDHAAVLNAVRDHELESLRAQVPSAKPVRIEGTFIGPELRKGLYDLPADEPTPLRPWWALQLNTGWPLSEYWRVGGFNESMHGYGYEDMEFGARAAQAGVWCVPRPELWALHVWHPKPPEAMVENQRNLDLYLRWHGHFLRRTETESVELLESGVDWRLWWHYHAERGGTVARSAGRWWAISGSRQHRLELSDPSWLPKLGHCPHEDSTIPASDLDQMTDHGTATD